MNQILNTRKTKDMTFFRIQFIFSIIIQIVLSCFIIYYFISIRHKDRLSLNLKDNYSIYKLYSKYSQESNVKNEILGIIEIPKIKVNYPIFSRFDDELLKISPCKFYGESPKENGNLCIAGHNYNNSKFFSKLFLLDVGDKIYIYDNLGYKYIYEVYCTYEVNSSDMSPVYSYDQSSKELTLVTCNNLNQNRLIVRAKQ